jgi:hypothetical protein
MAFVPLTIATKLYAILALLATGAALPLSPSCMEREIPRLSGPFRGDVKRRPQSASLAIVEGRLDVARDAARRHQHDIETDVACDIVGMRGKPRLGGPDDAPTLLR